jgi:hypothetical protein
MLGGVSEYIVLWQSQHSKMSLRDTPLGFGIALANHPEYFSLHIVLCDVFDALIVKCSVS